MCKKNGVEVSEDSIRNVQYTEALNPDSVEVSMGAKGEIKFVVKSYANTVEEAKEKATKVFDALFEQYNGISIYKVMNTKKE